MLLDQKIISGLGNIYVCEALFRSKILPTKFTNELVKKNGIMYNATLNKTLKSYIFAIVGAEYILRWLPIGTHEWEKFVEPSKLIEYGKRNSLKLEKINGMKFNPLINKWNISEDSSVNYIAEFKKF